MIKCYTDGSNYRDKKISWAFVAVKNGKEIHSDSGCLIEEPENYLSMWNVAGEIEGTLAAIDWAKENLDDDIEIITDYKGIIHWTTGKWDSSKRIWTRRLKKGFDDVVSNISHVYAHSGNKWNERADDLARNALRKEEPLSSSLTRNRNGERLVELRNPVVTDSTNVYDISKSKGLDQAFDAAKQFFDVRHGPEKDYQKKSDFLLRRFKEAKRGNELSKKKIVLHQGKELTNKL